MSGYFDSLLERALGRAPSLMPRRASMFESATTVAHEAPAEQNIEGEALPGLTAQAPEDGREERRPFVSPPPQTAEGIRTPKPQSPPSEESVRTREIIEKHTVNATPAALNPTTQKPPASSPVRMRESTIEVLKDRAVSTKAASFREDSVRQETVVIHDPSPKTEESDYPA